MSQATIEFAVGVPGPTDEISVTLKVNDHSCQVGSSQIGLSSPLTVGEAKLIANAYVTGLWDGTSLDAEEVNYKLRRLQAI